MTRRVSAVVAVCFFLTGADSKYGCRLACSQETDQSDDFDAAASKPKSRYVLPDVERTIAPLSPGLAALPVIRMYHAGARVRVHISGRPYPSWSRGSQETLNTYFALEESLRNRMRENAQVRVAPLGSGYRELAEFRDLVAMGPDILPVLFFEMATTLPEPFWGDLAAEITGIEIRSAGDFYPPTTDRAVELWLDWWDANRKE